MTGEARPPKARRWFRFSLRTLLFASLLAGGAMLVHSQWAPWTEETFLPPEAEGSSYAEFSPDGTRILTVHRSEFIRLWESSDFTELVRLHIPGSEARLSPDGRWIVVFPHDGQVSVWDADTGKEQARLRTTLRFDTGAFAPDGSWLLTGSGREADAENPGWGAHLWDLRTGEKVLTVEPKEHVADVSFSPCGRRFLTTTIRPLPIAPDRVGKPEFTMNGQVRIWNAATGRETVALQRSFEHIPDVQFFADGSKVGTTDGSKLQVWRALSGELLAESLYPGGGGLLVSPDGRRLLAIAFSASGGRCIVNLVDGAGLSEIAPLSPKRPSIHLGTFSPEGQRILLSNASMIWSAEDGAELWDLGRPLIGVNEHSFDPEGCRIVSGDENGAIHIWSRRRPERWWGAVCLPAFWVTLLVCGAFVWSIRRDRKTL